MSKRRQEKGNVEIILAKSAGFCFGVNRAIESCYKEIEKGGKIYTYGPLIHNKNVNADLAEKGVKSVDSLEGCEDGTVIIRSHGVGKSVYDELDERIINYVDGTCPFVKKIHKIVSDRKKEGFNIIIIGDRKHPEVMGINGWCDNSAVIVDNAEEARELVLEPDKKYAVVVQTTFRESKYSDIFNVLKEKSENIKAYNTICSATEERQKEAVNISQIVDKMLVIGDKGSSNTQKLFEICEKNCRNTSYIETINDLVLNNYKFNDRIGITAGASTPPAIIKEVITTMSEMDGVKNTMEGEELTFEQMLNESFVTLHTGDVVKGTVISTAGEEVSVNLGYKSDGVIPRGEFSSDTTVVPSKTVQAGDEIEVFVVRVNDGDGNVLLSKRKVESQKGMEDIEKAYEDKAVVTGKVTEIVKGGLIAVVNGIRVFIPSSQVSGRFVEDLSVYKGKDLSFNIIELDRSKRRIIGGRKALVAKEAEKKKTAVFENLETGKKIIGKVSRLTDFGAFVDLGGVDGLIHISEMSWGRILNPKEVLSEGDTVEVVVLDVDKEKSKISLSLKDVQPNPWSLAAEKYAVGAVVEGKVVRMVPFGAFIELEPGVDGLVHISQIANKRVEKPEDELTIGEIIKVKVIDVNAEQKKISLSKKDAEAPIEEAPVEEAVTEE
ncbi:MAG: bifunctional 4-hydroxy-3-methylbut-2-enyl diphosphate reductase/30S ribosomal protein S1 [Candidatus Metalachnospira sp.]|nr:bifunctional 4-hydroxy-3-methylbut-2-enyl diphosphate reductase/30S ribosomal protein S1 [Candidatus Metalachnospira sp.]